VKAGFFFRSQLTSPEGEGPVPEIEVLVQALEALRKSA
jgi:hypothetical protein